VPATFSDRKLTYHGRVLVTFNFRPDVSTAACAGAHPGTGWNSTKQICSAKFYLLLSLISLSLVRQQCLNMAVLCMRNASVHNYCNSSFTVELPMGQMPRSTVRISSFTLLCACAMENMQYNPYLRPNCRNFRVLKEIGVGTR